MVSEHRDRLAILDVGHGNCAVVVSAGQVMVIDAGPKLWLQTFLAANGLSVVDEVLLSHPDRDHIAGLVQLLASRTATIRRVWVDEEVEKNTDLWDDLVHELRNAHNAGSLVFERVLVRERSGQCRAGDVEVEVLHPSGEFLGYYQGQSHPSGLRLSGHSVNAVFRVVRGGRPITLFFGDLDQVGLEELCSSNIDLSTPIAVFPHHGGGTGKDAVEAFVDRLCTAVRPATVVFSIGRGVHNTPDPQIVGALIERLPDVRVVCTELSEHCAETLPSDEPVHLATTPARGREQWFCCAGSLVVDLESQELTPIDQAHVAFVEQHAPTALCRKRPADPRA
jgi:beta-lactamase superfamily II metal-dependent hydrolase